MEKKLNWAKGIASVSRPKGTEVGLKFDLIWAV